MAVFSQPSALSTDEILSCWLVATFSLWAGVCPSGTCASHLSIGPGVNLRPNHFYFLNQFRNLRQSRVNQVEDYQLCALFNWHPLDLASRTPESSCLSLTRSGYELR
jgi:hypothetical protein